MQFAFQIHVYVQWSGIENTFDIVIMRTITHFEEKIKTISSHIWRSHRLLSPLKEATIFTLTRRFFFLFLRNIFSG